MSLAGLWKRTFWNERQMSAEFGPSPATVYRAELAGLSDLDIVRFGHVAVENAKKARSEQARAAAAGAPR